MDMLVALLKVPLLFQLMCVGNTMVEAVSYTLACY